MAKEKLIQIVDRVNRMDKIIWSEMLSIRNDDLKQHTEQQLEKLEQSLIHNGFIEPFAAWQDPKTKEIYTINGHTRKKRLLALIDKGYSIPEKLSAFFIDCKNLNDAASVLPLYESKYGNLDASKLEEFKITFELDETKVVGSTLDFFSIEINQEGNDKYSLKNKEIDVNEFSNNMIIKLEYPEDEYHLVIEKLLQIEQTPEAAIFKLLGITKS